MKKKLCEEKFNKYNKFYLDNKYVLIELIINN